MSIIEGSAVLEQLHWRYATKKFDPARKVSDAHFATLLKAATLAPSSFGLQPWKLIVVNSPAMREKLTPASWNQSQIKDCSHLVVFAVRTGIDGAYVDHFIKRVAEVRHLPPAALEGYKQVMMGTVQSQTPEQVDAWSTNQVYISLGFLLAAAAMIGADVCPMEGIDKAKYDEILGLTSQGLAARCVAAIGYRADDDHAAKYTKVRFDDNEVVAHVD